MSRIDKNIILIGMPGCGKSTIGKELALNLKIKFCDIDEYIEKDTNMSITQIFNMYGEKCFRDIETNITKKVSKVKPQVIATGGGIVKDKINIDYLKKYGMIFFINRSIEDIYKDINVNDRPLLEKNQNKIYKLYKERFLLYKKYCDFEITNNDKERCINKILKIINID